MFNCPDHPDIASALRTGYPRQYDEDWERKNRIEEELIEEASSDEADKR